MIIEAIVEIPFGSKYKYEVDKDTGKLKVDRPLLFPLPYNYGYFEGTLCGDGDPLDVCILGLHPIQSLAKVKVKVIGALICNDNGDSDDKILAVVDGELFEDILLQHMTNQLVDFLSTYKKGFEIKELVDQQKAIEIYEQAVRN